MRDDLQKLSDYELYKLADSELTDSDTLAELILHNSSYVQFHAAKNPNLDKEMFYIYALSDERYIQTGLASNPKVTYEGVMKLLNTKKLVTKQALSRNPYIPVEWIERLKTDGNKLVRREFYRYRPTNFHIDNEDVLMLKRIVQLADYDEEMKCYYIPIEVIKCELKTTIDHLHNISEIYQDNQITSDFQVEEDEAGNEFLVIGKAYGEFGDESNREIRKMLKRLDIIDKQSRNEYELYDVLNEMLMEYIQNAYYETMQLKAIHRFCCIYIDTIIDDYKLSDLEYEIIFPDMQADNGEHVKLKEIKYLHTVFNFKLGNCASNMQEWIYVSKLDEWYTDEDEIPSWWDI